jgi:hypothetical protein
MLVKRWDIINKLIQSYSYKSYLEIGVNLGRCFRHIQAKHKISVDPKKKCEEFELTHQMTSDDFFVQNTETFDVIFIDGLHRESQCTKDIKNALNVLNENGTIVVHDCLPLILAHTTEKPTNISWWGTSYKSIIELRYTSPELSIEVVDADCGCGIIRKGEQVLYDKVSLETAKTFEYYNTNKRELMNVITVEQFTQNYC